MKLFQVEESMSNIETVVRERNRAYYLLETGEDGEQPCKTVFDAIGKITIYLGLLLFFIVYSTRTI